MELLHAALLVTDLQRSAHFYGDLLDLPLAPRPLEFPGLWYQVGAAQLHLMTATTVPGDRVNLHQWGRNRHLAFQVADLSALAQRLEAAGYPVQGSSSGRPAFFTADPDGHILEFSALAS
jgi:glyoxylase I family protein